MAVAGMVWWEFTKDGETGAGKSGEPVNSDGRPVCNARVKSLQEIVVHPPVSPSQAAADAEGEPNRMQIRYCLYLCEGLFEGVEAGQSGIKAR